MSRATLQPLDCRDTVAAGEWHRHAIMASLCATIGPDWIREFSRRRSRLALYIAVDNHGDFYRIERVGGILGESRFTTSDSTQLAAVGFFRDYHARLAAMPFCWPAPNGVIEQTYDTLRTDKSFKLVKRYTLPLFCTAQQPCGCP